MDDRIAVEDGAARLVARWRRAALGFGYLLATLPLTALAFVLAVLSVVASVLSLVGVGLPVLVGVLAAARAVPRLIRPAARRLQSWDWADPPPRPAGPIGMVADPTAWRVLAYGVLRLPLAFISAYVPAGIVVGMVLLIREPDSPTGVLLSIAQVLLALAVLPWLLDLALRVDRALTFALLAPTADAARVRQLEAGRAALTAEAASELRRLERDLHDGTQARLTMIGIMVSRLEAQAGGADRLDGAAVRTAAGELRTAVAAAIAELREIVRGIHPPALDGGLDTALATLAALAPVPTELHHRPPAELDRRLGGSAAQALYYAASELLANVGRHADASSATIELVAGDGGILLTVTDDGAGGAAPRPDGGGLAGLRRRAEALDGRLTVDSPTGGPTRITFELPAP